MCPTRDYNSTRTSFKSCLRHLNTISSSVFNDNRQSSWVNTGGPLHDCLQSDSAARSQGHPFTRSLCHFSQVPIRHPTAEARLARPVCIAGVCRPDPVLPPPLPPATYSVWRHTRLPSQSRGSGHRCARSRPRALPPLRLPDARPAALPPRARRGRSVAASARSYAGCPAAPTYRPQGAVAATGVGSAAAVILPPLHLSLRGRPPDHGGPLSHGPRWAPRRPRTTAVTASAGRQSGHPTVNPTTAKARPRPSVYTAATPWCCRRWVCPAPGRHRCHLETVLVLSLLLPVTLLAALPYHPTAKARPRPPVGAAATPYCCRHCPRRNDVIKRQYERRGRDCQTGTWTSPSWAAR